MERLWVTYNTRPFWTRLNTQTNDYFELMGLKRESVGRMELLFHAKGDILVHFEDYCLMGVFD